MLLIFQYYIQTEYSYLQISKSLRSMSKFSCCTIFSVTFSYFITFILILIDLSALYQNEVSVFIDSSFSNKVTKFSEEFRYLIIFVFTFFFSFEHFEILTVSIMMKVMASAISGLSCNKAFISLVITFFFSFYLLTCLV